MAQILRPMGSAAQRIQIGTLEVNAQQSWSSAWPAGSGAGDIHGVTHLLKGCADDGRQVPGYAGRGEIPPQDVVLFRNRPEAVHSRSAVYLQIDQARDQ